MDSNQKFENYMKGFYASVELGQKAQSNGSFIECVCLYANQIDAILRIGLILRKQLETDSSELIEELLYQGEGDKIITERKIYADALDAGIIDEAMFDQLENLYKERNKVVHRYIISELTTKMVLQIAIGYHKLLMAVREKIAKLERLQVESGRGMTRSVENVPKEKIILDIKEMAIGKHDGVDIHK